MRCSNATYSWPGTPRSSEYEDNVAGPTLPVRAGSEPRTKGPIAGVALRESFIGVFWYIVEYDLD